MIKKLSPFRVKSSFIDSWVIFYWHTWMVWILSVVRSLLIVKLIYPSFQDIVHFPSLVSFSLSIEITTLMKISFTNWNKYYRDNYTINYYLRTNFKHNTNFCDSNELIIRKKHRFCENMMKSVDKNLKMLQ